MPLSRATTLLLPLGALALIGPAGGCALSHGNRSAGCCSLEPGCAALPRTGAATAPSLPDAGSGPGAADLPAYVSIARRSGRLPGRQSADVPNAAADELPERAAVGLIGPAQVGLAAEDQPAWWTRMSDGVRHLWRFGEERLAPEPPPGLGRGDGVSRVAERSSRSIPLPLTNLQQADPGSLATWLLFPQRTARRPVGPVRRSDGIAANRGRDLSAPSQPAGEAIPDAASQPVFLRPPTRFDSGSDAVELEEWPYPKRLERDDGYGGS